MVLVWVAEQGWFDLGVLLSQLGRHDEASQAFNTALSLNPSIKLTMLGQIYHSFAQLARAGETYRAAIEKDPTDIDAIFGYAQVCELIHL